MQITEITNEGLKREFAIVIAAADMEKRIAAHVDALKARIRMPGFRPGKVPTSLIRKMHGESLRGQALQEAVNETTQKVIEDKKLRPALQPNVEITKFEEDADLEYKVALEVLPEIVAPDFADLKLEKLVAEVDEPEIDQALERLAAQQKTFKPAAKGHAAEEGDALVIDFVGTLDGTAFEGGAGEDFQLELGSGAFIPGFEAQLVGAKAGEARTVTVTFPQDYPDKKLAGKAAAFEVSVREVKNPEPAKVDEDLAKNVGLESLAALRALLKERLERELAQMARANLKRRLLDALAARHDFPVPQGMVDAEFQQIWATLLNQVSEEERKNLEGNDAEKADYRRIAERRVRLGLLLAEVGQKNKVEIRQEEVNRLIAEEARRFPGQEREVFEFYRKNPSAMAQVRAPLYEDKVVDFILELAEVTERKVSRAELEAVLTEDEEAADKPAAKAGEKPAKKAAKAEKATKGEGDKEKAKKAPAKKPRAKKAENKDGEA
ncbi:MAG: trigger factor [Pseudomonadota bacterium]